MNCFIQVLNQEVLIPVSNNNVLSAHYFKIIWTGCFVMLTSPASFILWFANRLIKATPFLAYGYIFMVQFKWPSYTN